MLPPKRAPSQASPWRGRWLRRKAETVGGLVDPLFTDSKPSVSGFESERKKEPMDMELSRTAEAE